jgi:hypothetical protein
MELQAAIEALAALKEPCQVSLIIQNMYSWESLNI